MLKVIITDVKIGHKPSNGAEQRWLTQIGAATLVQTGRDYQDIFLELFSELQFVFNPLSSIRGIIL